MRRRIRGKAPIRRGALARTCQVHRSTLAHARETSIILRVDGRSRVGTSVILLAALAACSPTPTETSFARYYFEAPEARGVLEVTESPPSICYSTQSNPARPISIVRGSLAASPTVASFVPRVNDFCGTVTPNLAAELLADPSRYSVRWSPLAGERMTVSSFVSVP
jgi:hypothetical protein